MAKVALLRGSTPRKVRAKGKAERASFVLRDLDPEMWQKVKIKAATEGRTVKHVVVTLIEDWAGTPAKRS
jgi:hypothetical protein